MKRAVATLMIATSFLFTVRAEATPISGASRVLAEKQKENSMRPPVTEWQQEVLDIINEPEKKEKKAKKKHYTYAGENTLNRRNGVFNGPSGKESYYNLPMQGVVRKMNTLGYRYPYWVRQDGVKMMGDYVMVAADLRIRPKGTVLQTSLGQAIVCDTGTFTKTDSTALDVAVSW